MYILLLSELHKNETSMCWISYLKTVDNALKHTHYKGIIICSAQRIRLYLNLFQIVEVSYCKVNKVNGTTLHRSINYFSL
jgi:hypothetical protein